VCCSSRFCRVLCRWCKHRWLNCSRLFLRAPRPGSGADAKKERAMKPAEGDDSGGDTTSSVHRPSGGHHPGDLEGKVDEMEQRVVAEQRSADAQGSAGREGEVTPRRDKNQDPK